MCVKVFTRSRKTNFKSSFKSTYHELSAFVGSSGRFLNQICPHARNRPCKQDTFQVRILAIINLVFNHLKEVFAARFFYCSRFKVNDSWEKIKCANVCLLINEFIFGEFISFLKTRTQKPSLNLTYTNNFNTNYGVKYT